MSKRVKPYSSTDKTFEAILGENMIIPMNQRSYDWTEVYLVDFLTDMFSIYNENKYVEKMGSIIKLLEEGKNFIYDGQQRIITTTLILKALETCSTHKRFKNNIIRLLTIDTELDTLTEEHEEVVKKYDTQEYIPRIYCVNDKDMAALVSVFNNKVLSWRCHVKDYNPDNIDDETPIYCKHCGYCTKNHSPDNFIKHIVKEHNFIDYCKNNDSKIYKSFILILIEIINQNFDDNKIISFSNFIKKDIDIHYYTCTDPVYVSRIFDWENNRGKPVKFYDIVKNTILIKIPPEKRLEIYDKWQTLIEQPLGEKMFDISCFIYYGSISRGTDKREAAFRKMANTENNVLEEILYFFGIIENLYNIYDEISKNKYGKIIQKEGQKRLLNWEAYSFLMLPIFYKRGSLNTELIKLLTQWYIRNTLFKTPSFTKLCYADTFIEISNNVLREPVDNDYNYLSNIKDCLIKNRSDLILDKPFKSYFKTKPLKHAITIRSILKFLETVSSTYAANISDDDYDIEHIVCKDFFRNNIIIDDETQHFIGNLTFLEAKNTDDNKHRGNRSCGAKEYKDKIASYSGSNSVLTREISKKYKTKFGVEEIKTRTEDLVNVLNETTKYFP